MSGRRLFYCALAVFVIQSIILYQYFRFERILYISPDKVDDIFNPKLNLSQDNPQILEIIRKDHIFSPPMIKRTLTKEVELLDSKGVPELIKLLDNNAKAFNDRPGFFIECGANDGEFYSNTIDLEVNKNWTGLLIEGSPALFEKLKSTNRNAWLANTCLSGPQPEKIEFLKHKNKFPLWRKGNGKINPGGKYKKPRDIWSGTESFKRKDYISEGFVNCFPLYSILLAMNVTQVDFFSLDIEGHEYKVLEAIPYDKINIDVIFVEHLLAPEGKTAIRSLLERNGYVLVKETKSDYLFEKKLNFMCKYLFSC